jgi:hypothetical protein
VVKYIQELQTIKIKKWASANSQSSKKQSKPLGQRSSAVFEKSTGKKILGKTLGKTRENPRIF